jgi:hypothetical protein
MIKNEGRGREPQEPQPRQNTFDTDNTHDPPFRNQTKGG